MFARPPRPLPCHRGPGSLVLALFTATLFLSSALLFLVQPMFAKMALPRLGGTPAVWNTCLVFFQVGLLGGYLYAHLAPRIFGLRWQAILHVAVLATPLLCLPLGLPDGWSPAPGRPVSSLLLCLTVSVALPFFVVSTTGPLLQRWFTATGHRSAVDPYFLYAASNSGSLLALLAYPLAIEPWLRLKHQAALWAVGYGVLALMISACVLCLLRYAPPARVRSAYAPHASPTWQRRLRWIVLSAVPSSWLMGVTTFITSDIAAVPLFWVIPLALYLLTFVLCFLKRPPVPHGLMVRLLPVMVLGIALLQLVHAAQPAWLILTIHVATFFIGAMVCHGELARQRPAAEHLTDYYLMMSIGGAIGGAFNALAAPVLLARPLEYPLAIVAACLLLPRREIVRRRPAEREHTLLNVTLDVILPIGVAATAAGILIGLKRVHAAGASLSVLGAALPLLACVAFRARRVRFALAVAGFLAVAMYAAPGGSNVLEVRRSFFGVHRIVQSQRDATAFNDLYHGSTLHGREFIDADHRPAGADRPLTYYHPTGPVGDVMARLAKHPSPRVAVVGLGIGSVAAYGHAGWTVDFYEIDPAVAWAAEKSGRFDFLAGARARGADVHVTLGDARLTLRDAPDETYDVIVLDAFSGDAVPVHLLTREAISTYLTKLTPTGLLAVHTSNVYVNLPPVLAAAARDARLTLLLRDDDDVPPLDMAAGKSPSQWVAMAREATALSSLVRTRRWQRYAGDVPPVWTDDYSDVIGVMRWRR